MPEPKPRCEWCGGPCNRHGAQYCCRRCRADAERSRQHGTVLAAYVALGRNLPRLAQTLGVTVRRARQLVEVAERAQAREQARPEPVREIRSRPAHTREPGAARPACPYCGQALQLDGDGEWHCPPGPGHPFSFRPLKPGERPSWLPVWGSLGRKGKGGGSGNKSRQKSAVQQRMDAWRRRRQTGE